MFRNSSSANKALIFSLSNPSMRSAFSSHSTGASRITVANCLDNRASSAPCSTFSFSLPESLSVLASRPSTDPNSFRNLRAVFSPTPGMPGILSAESPINPSRSITCKGLSTSNFSHTSFTPSTSSGFPMRPGLYHRIFSVTNWERSLSGDMMNTVNPSFSAFCANVPITSSASYPSHTSSGTLNASHNRSM